MYNIAAYDLVPHDCKTVRPDDRFGRLLVLAIGPMGQNDWNPPPHAL